MACHALNEAKLVNLGAGFENVVISALPMHEPFSPVTIKSQSQVSEIAYSQLIVFENADNAGTTDLMNAFHKACNQYQPIHFQYGRSAVSFDKYVTISGLLPTFTNMNDINTLAAFSIQLHDDRQSSEERDPAFLEQYGIIDIAQQLSLLMVNLRGSSSKLPDCDLVVTYSKARFAEDGSSQRSSWKGGKGASGKGGGKGKGQRKGKGASRSFSSDPTPKTLYNKVSMWNFILTGPTMSLIQDFVAAHLDSREDLTVQTPLSVLHAIKDGIPSELRLTISTSRMELQQANTCLEKEMEAQRLSFMDQLGLPFDDTSIYANAWRFITQRWDESVQIDRLYDLWEKEGLRLRRQPLGIEDNEIPSLIYAKSAQHRQALINGYRRTHRNPISCAAGDAVQPGSPQCFYLYVLFETEEMARKATSLAHEHGREEGWLLRMDGLKKIPNVSTFANKKSVTSRTSLHDVVQSLTSCKKSYLKALEQQQASVKGYHPYTLSCRHEPRDNYFYPPEAKVAHTGARAEPRNKDKANVSSQAQRLLLMAKSAGTGSGNNGPPLNKSNRRKEDAARAIQAKKRSERRTAELYSQMFTADNVTDSVEKIAMQEFQSIQQGYKAYADAQKQEQGRALGEAMFKMSKSDHNDSDDVHDVSSSPEQTEQEVAPPEGGASETGRENLNAKMQDAASEESEDDQQDKQTVASVNGKRQSPNGATGQSPPRSRLKRRAGKPPETNLETEDGPPLSKADKRKQKKAERAAAAAQAQVRSALQTRKTSNYHEFTNTSLSYMSNSIFPHLLQNAGSGRGSKNG